VADPPKGVEELNFNYWTSLSRLGCIGEITNCFNTQPAAIDNLAEYQTYFWRMFDRTDNGACVALQTLPFGLDEPYGTPAKDLNRYDLGPVFESCKANHYFACEALGRRSKFIDETEITVK